MAKKSQKELLAALSQFGYPLIEPETKTNPNELLAALVESEDSRLLEGFPVVLAECLNRRESEFDPHKVEKLLKKENHPLLHKLFALSLLLFDHYQLSLPRQKVRLELADDELKNKFLRNEPVAVGKKTLDPERLKKTFFEYAVRSRAGLGQSDQEKTELNEEFRREYYLSLLLTPRQKELVYKRLRGEKLTKTEREYFSRVVKKKLLALADPDLHRLAQNALQ